LTKVAFIKRDRLNAMIKKNKEYKTEFGKDGLYFKRNDKGRKRKGAKEMASLVKRERNLCLSALPIKRGKPIHISRKIGTKTKGILESPSLNG